MKHPYPPGHPRIPRSRSRPRAIGYGGQLISLYDAAGGRLTTDPGPPPSPPPPPPSPPPPPPLSWLTSVEVLGDSTIAVTSPSSLDVPVPTNGWVIRVTTNTSATTCDPTAVTVNVTDQGFAADGSSTTVSRTITGVARLRHPYNEGATFNPSTAGVFDITLDQQIYRPASVTADGTQIVSLTFTSSFISGQSGGSYSGSVTRSDSKSYPLPIWRAVDRPGRRMGSGETLDYEWAVVHEWAQQGRQVACVEAWARVGGVDGTVARAGAMTESIWTPSTSFSGLRAPVYKTTISGSGLSDGSGEIRSRVKPWIGPAVDSVTIGDAWPTPNLPQGLPFLLDAAGNHAPVYAWVLWDGTGTATTSAKLHTDTTDPGTGVAENFATFATACTAIKSYNNARGHNDHSGGIIMLRDVATSVAGTDAGAYLVRTAFTGSTGSGATPLIIQAASGALSDLCRMRGQDASGTNGASKGVAAHIVWRNIYFDSSGTANTANNTIIDASSTNGAATTVLSDAVQAQQVFENCKIEENSASVGSNAVRARMGWIWDYGVWHRKTVGNSSFSTAAGQVVAAGSKYGGVTAEAATPNLPKTLILGSWIYGGSTSQQTNANSTLPAIKGFLWINSRIDGNQTSGQTVNLYEVLVRAQQDTIGAGISGVLARRVDTGSGPFFRFGADGIRCAFSNVVVQHLSMDDTPASGGRLNGLYNDQGWHQVVKEASFKFCAFASVNNKDGYFGANESPSNYNDGQYDTTKVHYCGEIVHDGNATLGSRLVWQAIRDVPANTLMSDTTYWDARGAVWSTAFNSQPLRTGNMRWRYGVNSYGNVTGPSVNSPPDSTPGYNNNWLSTATFPGSGSKWGGADPTLFYTTPAGGTGSWDTLGDYTPSLTGPLLSMVPAGLSVMPFDMNGVSRRNDGTGAAGALERTA